MKKINYNKIIAIDYDETITDNTPFPKEGKIRKEAKIYIKKLYDKGYTLILWTARKEPYYSQCIERLKKENLFQYFSFTYSNSPCGKINADFYIDDKSIIGKLKWNKIYNYIIKNIK